MSNEAFCDIENPTKHNIEKTLQEEDSEESKGQYVIKLEANPDDADEDKDVDAASATVASFVAQSKHTLTIDDVRVPDPRYPHGSLCLQVSICLRCFVAHIIIHSRWIE